MGRIVISAIIFFLFFFPFLCSGSTITTFDGKKLNHGIKRLESSFRVSTTQKDITTPITTIPTITPSITTSSTNPILNPDSNPDSTPSVTMNPMSTSSPAISSSSGGKSWCIASQSASKNGLQVGIDYACGYGKADCSEIQVGGNCYNPNTLHDHASHAFNTYYQRNPIPASCNFGGTAVITSTDPSTETCEYPSTSTSASILNTTNLNGSTVYGVGPSNPTPPSSIASIRFKFSFSYFVILQFLLVTLPI